MENVTFVFEDGKTYAIHEGKVVDAADTLEELEEKLASGAESLVEEAIADESDDKDKKKDDEDEDCDDNSKASHIETPNGLRGQILGRTKDLWGETVTVRFANGRIVQLPVTESTRFASEEEKVELVTPIQSLRERLDVTVAGTEDELTKRQTELATIHREAQVHIAGGVGVDDARELDEIATLAEAERLEVKAALTYLADAEAIAPPEHPYQAAPPQGYGPDSGWLENTADQMIQEAQATDYDKLMDEGPEAFVSALPDGSLADQGATHQLASSYVRGKTAGTDPEVQTEFESVWLARVEEVRQAELKSRQASVQKVAATEETELEGPDEGIFL